MVALKAKKAVPPGQTGLSWRLFTPTTQTRQSLVPSPDSVDATLRKITKNHIAVQSKTTQTPIITNASVTIWKERFLASESSRRTSLLGAWCQLLVEKRQWQSFLQKSTMRRWKRRYTAEKARLIRTSAILESCTEVDKICPASNKSLLAESEDIWCLPPSASLLKAAINASFEKIWNTPARCSWRVGRVVTQSFPSLDNSRKFLLSESLLVSSSRYHQESLWQGL